MEKIRTKLKVATIVGTRPELIRLSVIIRKFDNFFDHILIHTGQNYDYELNEIFFKELDIRKPDFFLNDFRNCILLNIFALTRHYQLFFFL